MEEIWLAMQDLLITLSQWNRALAAKKLLYCFFLNNKAVEIQSEEAHGEKENLV